MLRWTPERLAVASSLVERLEGSLVQAAAALTKEWGRRVSSEALGRALRRHREETPLEAPRVNPTRDTAPSATPAAVAAEDDVAVVVAATAKRDTTFEALADRLEWHPARLRGALEEARVRGYAVHVEGDRVGRPPAVERADVVPVPVAAEGLFAVSSDIHVGNRHFLRNYFTDFVGTAYEAGVRLILVPGDIVDGCYPFARWEWSHGGFEAQAEHAAEVFPKLPGLRYVGITGNHDETFEVASGLRIHHAIVDVFRRVGRDDLELVGQRGAYVRLHGADHRRGAVVHLWHPRGSGAYAVSYKLQKKIEAYQPGKKPDFLFCGHYHQQGYVEERGVHAFMAGTFQGGGSAFGQSLVGSPKIGGWIVRYSLTEQGAVREVEPTWRGYQEVETVRDYQLG